jgi:hypothetical protein
LSSLSSSLLTGWQGWDWTSWACWLRWASCE